MPSEPLFLALKSIFRSLRSRSLSVIKVFQSLKSPLRFFMKITFIKKGVVYGENPCFIRLKSSFFQKSVVFCPCFHRKSVVFDYWFYRKSVFLISVGIAYLPIYYIMCIGQKSNTTTEVASIVLLSIQLPA